MIVDFTKISRSDYKDLVGLVFRAGIAVGRIFYPNTTIQNLYSLPDKFEMSQGVEYPKGKAGKK